MLQFGMTHIFMFVVDVIVFNTILLHILTVVAAASMTITEGGMNVR